MTVDTLTEVRCPEPFGKLLFKLRQDGERPVYVDGTLIELACDDCKRRLRAEGEPIVRVLHRFNVLGECSETVTVRQGR